MENNLVSEALAAPSAREFLLTHDTTLVDPNGLPDFCCLDPDTQERLQALLQAAGI